MGLWVFLLRAVSDSDLSDDGIDYERRKEYEERASQIESILQQEELWDTDLEDGKLAGLGRGL